MTLGELAQSAVRTGDLEQITALVDDLRARGFNYWGIFEAVSAWTGIGLAEWDALLEDL